MEDLCDRDLELAVNSRLSGDLFFKAVLTILLDYSWNLRRSGSNAIAGNVMPDLVNIALYDAGEQLSKTVRARSFRHDDYNSSAQSIAAHSSSRMPTISSPLRHLVDLDKESKCERRRAKPPDLAPLIQRNCRTSTLRTAPVHCGHENSSSLAKANLCRKSAHVVRSPLTHDPLLTDISGAESAPAPLL